MQLRYIGTKPERGQSDEQRERERERKHVKLRGGQNKEGGKEFGEGGGVSKSVPLLHSRLASEGTPRAC